jgi:hypothetical protein
MQIWKLLIALLVTGALFVLLPLILGTYGLMPPLNPKAKYILGITAGGLVLKIIFGDMVSGKFEYQKHGYDLCIITLGAALSSLSLQMVTQDDLFPGLQDFFGLGTITANVQSQRTILLSIVFLVSCIMSLITARIGMAIREDTTKGKNYLSLINFALGAGVFGAYILMLVTKR